MLSGAVYNTEFGYFVISLYCDPDSSSCSCFCLAAAAARTWAEETAREGAEEALRGNGAAPQRGGEEACRERTGLHTLLWLYIKRMLLFADRQYDSLPHLADSLLNYPKYICSFDSFFVKGIYLFWGLQLHIQLCQFYYTFFWICGSVMTCLHTYSPQGSFRLIHDYYF